MFGTIRHCHLLGSLCILTYATVCGCCCYGWFGLSFPCSYDSDRDAVWVDRAVYRAEYKPTLQ